MRQEDYRSGPGTARASSVRAATHNSVVTEQGEQVPGHTICVGCPQFLHPHDNQLARSSLDRIRQGFGGLLYDLRAKLINTSTNVSARALFSQARPGLRNSQDQLEDS